MEEFARKPLLFWTYYPLGAALYHKLVTYVGNFVIPEEAAAFPLLRSSTGTDRTGLVHEWNISRQTPDLRQEILYSVKILNEEEQRLSGSSIITHPLLVEYLEEQYRPERNPVMLRATALDRGSASGEGEFGAVGSRVLVTDGVPSE